MTTVGTRAIVSKGKVENILKKDKWVWRPKNNELPWIMFIKYNGALTSSEVLEYGNPEILITGSCMWDSGLLAKPYDRQQTYLSDYEYLNWEISYLGGPKSGGWDQFGSTIATALICLSRSKGYLAPTLTKKLFAYMKRGYTGDIVPLRPAMLAGAAVDQGEGSAQPAEPHHTPVDPISSTSQPPIPSPNPSPPPHSPLQSPPYLPPHSPPHSPHQSLPFLPPHFSLPRSYEAPLPKGNTSRSAEDSMQLKELIVLVLTLVTGIHSLEKELKDTKQTLGNDVVKLVKNVKSLEKALKRKSKKVLISESKGEESEDQGRKIQDIDDDPLVSLVRESMKEKLTDFGVSKEKSTDKGKRYRRRERSMAKKIDTGLDAEDEINNGREKINTGIEEVSTGSTKVDSGNASKRGQRDGKAPMIEEDIQATHKTKEQMRQEEARLEEAIKLQAQLDEEVAKQIHLDKMVAKRMAEEEALS
ncbi:hypothetical protein Tco_0465167 [Tanacetum coccineum]